MDFIKNITVNTKKLVLSSEASIYKTEQFIKSTRKLNGIDTFISKIAESVILNLKDFSSVSDSIKVITFDNAYTIFFTFGKNINSGVCKKSDLVFYKFISREKVERSNDRQLVNWLSRNESFIASFSAIKNDFVDVDFLKLYSIVNDDKVNFPLLNKEQRLIVESEDRNMLVQGVAGSGKTNVCIDKIIYSACRNYYGKTLYTTFSRGLIVDTKNKVETFKENLRKFVIEYQNGNIVFVDKNHKKAIENKLGIYFNSDDDEDILRKINSIIDYLTNKTDYFLIEDMYAQKISREYKYANENVFIHSYIGDLKNYKLAGTLEKIKYISIEIIYKEIYGMIFGKNENIKTDIMTREEYIEARQGSFTKTECDIIYTLATDYLKFLNKNGYIDNNIASKKIIPLIKDYEYSIAVIDEVQDFTQINLTLMKKLSMKMFCVGDALQMINPSYFSFPFLKRLMYGDEQTIVSELKHNYRNSASIERIIEELGKLNIKQFGTHSFVLNGVCVENGLPTETIYVTDPLFTKKLSDYNFGDITLICGTAAKKQELREKYKHMEILTVSEAKGLERNTVILVDILSDNKDKWDYLKNLSVNRKTADENSVYRYYFNLFYVGVSRAQQYLFVSEDSTIDLFKDLFNKTFSNLTGTDALNVLISIAEQIETDDDELLDRIQQFISLEQYDNARFTADKLSDDILRTNSLNRIDINENFVHLGKYREAGIEFWKKGMLDDARKMFRVSNDEALIELMDNVTNNGNNALSIDIVKFYPLVMDNPMVANIIIDTIKNDMNSFLNTQKEINTKIKKRIKA